MILLSALVITLSILNVLMLDMEIVLTATKSCILASLLLLVISKDKIEDELTSRIRLKAFASSFVFGVVITIVAPFINYFIFGDFISQKGITELLISMFCFYFFMIYILKKNR